MKSRTRVLFFIGVIFLVTELVSPPVGSFLMDRFNAFVPYAATIPLRLASFLFLLIIPETSSKPKTGERSSSENVVADESPNTGRLRQKVDQLLSHIRVDVLPLISRAPIILGLIALLVGNFARSVSEFLLQYMTFRFDWRWSQVSREHMQFSIRSNLSQGRLPHIVLSSNTNHCSLHSPPNHTCLVG
jgi:hypothetical protein